MKLPRCVWDIKVKADPEFDGISQHAPRPLARHLRWKILERPHCLIYFIVVRRNTTVPS